MKLAWLAASMGLRLRVGMLVHGALGRAFKLPGWPGPGDRNGAVCQTMVRPIWAGSAGRGRHGAAGSGGWATYPFPAVRRSVVINSGGPLPTWSGASLGLERQHGFPRARANQDTCAQV